MEDEELKTKIESIIGYKPKVLLADKIRYALEDAYDKAKKSLERSSSGEEFITNKNKFDEAVKTYSLFMLKITN